MHPQVLPAIRPRILHRRSPGNVRDLSAHALLDDLPQRLGIRRALEVERARERSERRKPARQGLRRERASVGHLEARCCTTAVGVADDENVFDADHGDGIHDHREDTGVIWMDLVGDITVNKDIAWSGRRDDALGDARVGASEPEDLRGLTLGRLLEEVWLCRVDGRGPLRVGQEELPEGGVHRS